MKRIIILCAVFFGSCDFAVGQQKIGVVDIETTINDWSDAVRLNQMLGRNSIKLKAMVELWLDKLKQKYDDYYKKIDSPTQQEVLANEILDGQEEILNFERILVDSVPRFKKEVLQMIETRIRETVTAVAEANNYDIIVAKDNILFFRGEEIDELIVTSTPIDLQAIHERVIELDAKLTAWIEKYSARIDQY